MASHRSDVAVVSSTSSLEVGEDVETRRDKLTGVGTPIQQPDGSADRLNVAIWHHLPSGGGKRALHDHVRGLVERGHALEAWCPPTADREFLPLNALISEQELPLGPLQVPGLARWLLDRVGADIEPLARLHAMSVHAERFAVALHAGHFDVLLAATCKWLFAPMIARHVRIPSVLYLQEPCRLLYEARPTLPWIAEEPVARAWGPRLVRQWLGSAARLHPVRVQAREELRSVRAFDRVLVNSRFSRESVLRVYGIDAKVCYLGIDTSRFLNYAGERRPVVLSVGEFGFHKNPEFVIRAVGLSETKPVLQWIANLARPDCVAQMTQLSQDLGVTLELKVGQSDDELRRHYQQGRALLFAPHLEPFGLAPLEANACGMPVIALAEGGVRETVIDGENGRLVDSPAEMAALLDRFIREPAEAQAMGQRGAAIVRERWTLDRATERLEEHLREVVGEHAAASRSLAPA